MISSLYKCLREHISAIKMSVVFVFLCFLSFNLTAQTVTTDKKDYSPGEVAIISGEGWSADTRVRIEIDEEPAYDYGHQYYADVVDGKWQYLFPIEDRH